MPVVTIANTDIQNITLTIDGVSQAIRKSLITTSNDATTITFNWRRLDVNDNHFFRYEKTFDYADVTSPTTADINELMATISQWIDNSTTFSATQWSLLAFTPDVDGTERVFIVSDGFSGDLSPIADGIALKKDDANGYTQSGNTITITNPPITLDIWGNKPL